MTTTHATESVTMSDFGETARLRRERLRATQDEVAEAAGVNRDTVGAVEAGKGSARSRGKVDDALTAMEAEAGFTSIAAPTPPTIPAPAPPSERVPHLVRIEVKNVYGASAIVVEGPVEDLPALEAAVDRIMRRRAAEQAGQSEGQAAKQDDTD